jgi:hypothetical protein
MEEVRCPKCLGEMKEYATRFICRNLTCRLEYKKTFPAGDSKADGIAQGRREVAEAWCNRCKVKHGYIRPDCHCDEIATILGTASDEKTDEGEI